jgi:hypothetical protein
MSAIFGLKVRPPNKCKNCDSEFAVIGPGDGKYYATLTCSCGRGRGFLTEFTGHWLETLVATFGGAPTITLRQVVQPADAQTVSAARSIPRKGDRPRSAR